MTIHSSEHPNYFDWLLERSEKAVGEDITNPRVAEEVVTEALNALNYLNKLNYSCEQSHALIALMVILQDIVLHHCCELTDTVSCLKDNFVRLAILSTPNTKSLDEYEECSKVFYDLYQHVLGIKSALAKKIRVEFDELRDIANLNFSNKTKAIELLQKTVLFILNSELPQHIKDRTIKKSIN